MLMLAFGQTLSRDKHPIFSILRTSYHSLPEDAQMLLMNTALFLPSHVFWSWDKYKWNLFDWLSMVHGSSVDKLMKQVRDRFALFCSEVTSCFKNLINIMRFASFEEELSIFVHAHFCIFTVRHLEALNCLM